MTVHGRLQLFSNAVVGLVGFVVLFSAGAASCWAEVHLTVGTPAQGGQYTTVQAAVDAVPSANTERYIIDIMPGTYTERVNVPSDKPYVTLRGQDPEMTVLTYYETAATPPAESTVHASTVVKGADFVAENLTFENSHGPGVQALAIYAKADRLIFNNCRFLGWQDTLRAEYGRQYYYNSYVEGSVDFIYGKGTAFFENSTIYAKANGYVTAQGREGPGDTNGYVFKSCKVTGSAANGSVYLGRPWAAYARVVYLDSKIGPVIKPAGWSNWSGTDYYLTCYFAEYNSMDLAGNPLDVSQRVSWSHQLTSAEADAFSKTNFLSGSDSWNPSLGLPGDYNDDGTVDAADYTVWRDTLGSTTNLRANGDDTGVSWGIIDEADYDVWKANFGMTAGSGSGQSLAAAVPEPATLTLGVLCLLALVRRRV
jgi:pectinesterase